MSQDLLRVESVSKRLGGHRVLDRLSLRVEAAHAVAVLGENGSGKSTLLRIVAGVLAPDEGAVFIGPAAVPRRAALARLGYVPEGADVPAHLTVAELLALVRALKGAPALPDATIDRLGARAILHQRVGSLSLGQRRRACLAAALVGAPPVLVLDEPTNGLDPDGVAMLAAVLGEHTAAGGAALVATHDLKFVDALSARTVRLTRVE